MGTHTCITVLSRVSVCVFFLNGTLHGLIGYKLLLLSIYPLVFTFPLFLVQSLVHAATRLTSILCSVNITENKSNFTLLLVLLLQKHYITMIIILCACITICF